MHWVVRDINTGSIARNFSFLFAELELADSKLIEDFDVFRFSSSSSTRYLFDLLT
jgi:hypothetical protein